MDRQIKAERAWLIPYLISGTIGGFEFSRLRSLSPADLRELMTNPVPLHRFSDVMTENYNRAVIKIRLGLCTPQSEAMFPR